MKLHELTPAAGATKPAYRKGRGAGSGNGKTAGRGHKGQWARSGGGVRPGFEGGQMPLARRLPKRGFHNIFGTTYAPVNVSALEKFEDGAEVTAEILCNAGIVKNALDGIKILGTGTLTKKLTVKAGARRRENLRKRRDQQETYRAGKCLLRGRETEDRGGRRKGRGGLRCFKPLKTPGLCPNCARRCCTLCSSS